MGLLNWERSIQLPCFCPITGPSRLLPVRPTRHCLPTLTGPCQAVATLGPGPCVQRGGRWAGARWDLQLLPAEDRCLLGTGALHTTRMPLV